MSQLVAPHIRTVIFDLDGTLYLKRGLARRLVARLWWSLPLILVDRLARGPLWRWVVRTRWHQRIYLPTMVRLIGQYCPVRPETLALIDECRRRNLSMAICSDYGCVRDKLDALGIDADQFALLISAPELGARKPSREAALQVMRRLNAQPATTLWVGDRDDTDGEAARSVGAMFLKV